MHQDSGRALTGGTVKGIGRDQQKIPIKDLDKVVANKVVPLSVDQIVELISRMIMHGAHRSFIGILDHIEGLGSRIAAWKHKRLSFPVT